MDLAILDTISQSMDAIMYDFKNDPELADVVPEVMPIEDVKHAITDDGLTKAHPPSSITCCLT